MEIQIDYKELAKEINNLQTKEVKQNIKGNIETYLSNLDFDKLVIPMVQTAFNDLYSNKASRVEALSEMVQDPKDFGIDWEAVCEKVLYNKLEKLIELKIK